MHPGPTGKLYFVAVATGKGCCIHFYYQNANVCVKHVVLTWHALTV